VLHPFSAERPVLLSVPFADRYFPQARLRLFTDAATHAEVNARRVPTRTSFARAKPDRVKQSATSDRMAPRPPLRAAPFECKDGWAEPASEETAETVSREAPVTADMLRARWLAAFDAAHLALRCASPYLPANELHDRAALLEAERDLTTVLLQALAQDEPASRQMWPLTFSPWDARQLLGLPEGLDACVFNLDGVLIGSASIHRTAWTETFDEFIRRRIERTGGRFAPFNPRVDYPQHIHGKPRLDGVRAFLASRGISLREGEPGDPPGLETVHGLANRKNQLLLRQLDAHGVKAFEGSRRYLEIARDAGLKRAVVSASANTQTILERSGLADLIDESVDGHTIAAEQLRPKPAPDTLLAACRLLGVDPQRAAAFETTPAGIASARAAGFRFVIGVNGTRLADALRTEAADLVVSGPAELLAEKIAA
jgi:HAD superfamily hydrolase (TIGR01509 family)